MPSQLASCLQFHLVYIMGRWAVSGNGELMGDKPAMPLAGPRGPPQTGRPTDGRRMAEICVSPLPRGFWDQKGGPLCMGEKTNSSNPPIKSLPPSGKRAG
jgi:hypothetical protein